MLGVRGVPDPALPHPLRQRAPLPLRSPPRKPCPLPFPSFLAPPAYPGQLVLPIHLDSQKWQQQHT